MVKIDFRRPQQADRIALVALGGIVMALASWLIFGVADAVMLGNPVVAEAFTSDPERTAARLFVVVLVLIATLVVEMIYSRKLQTESALDLERRRLDALYDHSPDAIVSFDSAGNVVYTNPHACALLGDVAGSSDPTRSARIRAYLDRVFAGGPARALASGESYQGTGKSEADGRTTWLHLTLYPVLDSAGDVESAVAVMRDETELHAAEERLIESHHDLESRVRQRTRDLERVNAELEIAVARYRQSDAALKESEERYRQMVDGSPDMVVVFRKGAVVFMNREGTRLLDCQDADAVVGKSVGDLLAPNGSGFGQSSLEEAVLNGGLAKPVHVHLKRPDGALVDVELSVVPLKSDGGDSVQCVVRDISERVRAQKTIQRMAYYDPLTDLPNRTLFRDRLATSLAQARRRDECVAVAFVDLDDFKSINDALGHAVGDGLLKVVAQRLRGLLRDEDTVARHSGDEFTVVARVADRAAAEVLGHRIMACLREPVVVEGHSLQVTASVGLAVFPDDGVLGSDLLRNADAAMYSAKKFGRCVCRVFVPEMTVDIGERLKLEQGLRSALENHEFELYYQPQVDIRDNKVVGVEALLRWNHPTRGRLLPGAFLEIAEQAGLMGEIGHWVLRDACEQAARWRADGLEFGRVAVNLSAREFVQQDIVENTRRALEMTGLPAEMLELEITETVAVYSVDQVLAILHLLREMGVRVAIDDFGTGYSSMSQVKRFPIQTIKIDQAFMRDVEMDLHSQAIASMLIKLCADLGLYVVAEGVEHASQLEFLREKGCFIVQGHVFSGSVPAVDIEPMLRNGVRMPGLDEPSGLPDAVLKRVALP